MILGTGTDICNAERIASLLERREKQFTQRVFTEKERAYADAASNHQRRVLRYSNRFAAKEATVKALGSYATGLSWQNIEVRREAVTGTPSLYLTGNAEEALTALAHPYTPHIHVSLSDEWPYSLAFVVISVAFS